MGNRKVFTHLSKNSAVVHAEIPKEKTLRKVLTSPLHPNTSGPYEKDPPPFGRPVFGCLFRLALQGEHEFLRRSRLDGSPDRNRQPAVERAKRLRLDDDQCRFGQRRCDDLFLGAESRWRDTAISTVVRTNQADTTEFVSTDS